MRDTGVGQAKIVGYSIYTYILVNAINSTTLEALQPEMYCSTISSVM